MSSNRRSSVASSSSANDKEINELIFRLQALLLPETTNRTTNLSRMATSEILEEVCKYIRKLNKEVEELSERLSELLVSTGYTHLLDADDVLTNLMTHH